MPKRLCHAPGPLGFPYLSTILGAARGLPHSRILTVAGQRDTNGPMSDVEALGSAGKQATPPGAPVGVKAGAGVGSGLAFITLAKLYFIVSGFAVQVGLPRFLGSPEAFGQYSLAMSIANVVDNVLIAATVQSLSKRVSENE